MAILSPEAELVLKDIFAIGSDKTLGLAKRARAPTPGPTELYALCELIARNPREEDLQQFLEQNVGFLPSLLGTADNTDLSVLFKPPVGTQFRADFCVMQSFQGGSVAHLIEIETCNEALFTKEGRPAGRYAHALKQAEDWSIWVNQNQVHYAKELVRMSEEVPLIGEQNATSRGVRFLPAERMKSAWEMFGGFDAPTFSYTVLMGRWSQLAQEHKGRLIHRNRHADGGTLTFTYEQLGRIANFRLDRDEW